MTGSRSGTGIGCNDLLGDNFAVYVDQIEADQHAERFLMDEARPHPKAFLELRHDGYELRDGRVSSLWLKGWPIAVAIVMRDDLNRSVLMLQRLSPNADSLAKNAE